MSKLYACIISADAKADREALLSIAQQFSAGIEMIEDGVLFDVSGLHNLIGDPHKITQKILQQIIKNGVSGKASVADTADTAILLARQNKGLNHDSASTEKFAQLPLQNLEIENDTLKIFKDLGIRTVEELRQIPDADLIGRYGRQFKEVIDVIDQKGSRLLTPNIKESNVEWAYQLDFPVDDFGQLIFILNHGLDKLFQQVSHLGFSTEHLDIAFKLQNRTDRTYQIKTSFPTVDKTFWLKLINLRVSLDPPESEIMSINVTSYFTRPRPTQKGLYAASRPDPENLLLTANKLKKLVGEENVGVPVLLDQRLSEAFSLDAAKLPQGKENIAVHTETSVIAFSYFNPPVKAEVLIRDKRLIFIRTRYFNGRVIEYSGVWKANSKWWDKSWKTQEWDVEIENKGIYRLCKVDKDWFLAGEYD